MKVNGQRPAAILRSFGVGVICLSVICTLTLGFGSVGNPKFSFVGAAAAVSDAEPSTSTGSANGTALDSSKKDSATRVPADNEIAAVDSGHGDELVEISPLANDEMALSSIIPGETVGPAAWVEHSSLRLGGADRYETAVSIVRHAYPDTADTVIVAMSDAFADSLSAAPLSARLKAPLLLVAQNSIPDVIRSELARLKPTKIIIAGGPGSVGTPVESALKQYAPNVTRIFGNDRYTTSAEIARFGWPSGATDVFIATGEGFADALSAGTAAAKVDAPVLLVQGSSSTLSQESSSEISRLAAGRIFIAGGPASVSPAIESLLGGQTDTVIRYSGKDRYEVSANVINAMFSGPADVYWASGLAFADALAGAAVAGAHGAALVLVESECVPSISYSATDKLVPGQILILGGVGTLQDSVRNGNECMSRPAATSDSDWSGIQELYTRLNQDRFERGLAGLRISDSTRGNPAQSWASHVVRGKAQNNIALTAAEPWVRYQVSAVTSASSNRVQRSYDLLRSFQGAASWIYQPNAGVRGYVSVGYATASGQSSAVLFLGAGLDD